MYDILFICAANVGRSQMAEGWYNHLTNGNNAKSAAGIQDVGLKYNYKPHPLVVDVMKEQKIDISHHKVKMLNKNLICKAKLIIFLCPCKLINQKFISILSLNKNIQSFLIEDPYSEIKSSTKEEVREKFRFSRDKIKVIITKILTFTKSTPQPPQ